MESCAGEILVIGILSWGGIGQWKVELVRYLSLEY